MNQQFFCSHGGISPHIESLNTIYEINRFCEPPNEGPFCDLLWSDPIEDYDTLEHPESLEFTPNKIRGCSYYYTFQAALQFLQNNRFLSIIRAHEAQAAGYKMHRRNEKTGFPTVITIFSAPNYLDMHNNKGAILRYENNVFNILQYNCSPHPYYLPGFANVFNWSLPFVAEKVAELLMSVFRLVDDAEADKEEYLMQRREIIRHKVMTVSKLLILYKTLRDKREALVVAGALSPKGTELPNTLESTVDQSCAEAVKKTLSDSLEEDSFAGAKILDRPNEKRPPLSVPLQNSMPVSEFQLRRYASRDKILSQKRNNSTPVTNRRVKIKEFQTPLIREAKT